MERQHLVGVAALLLMGCSTGKSRAEELGCFKSSNFRTSDICRAIAEEMEFQLMGHMILAPGYKVTTETVVRAYCRLGLTESDASAIKQLQSGGSAGRELLMLVGAVPVDTSEIFHPDHPSYVLKDGCPKR